MKCHGEDVFRMDGKIEMVDFYLKIWTTAITKLLKAAVFIFFCSQRTDSSLNQVFQVCAKPQAHKSGDVRKIFHFNQTEQIPSICMSVHESSTGRRYTSLSVLTVFNMKVATFSRQMDLCRCCALLKILMILWLWNSAGTTANKNNKENTSLICVLYFSVNYLWSK